MVQSYSGVVQLVARQPLELVILVRVQAPEPILFRRAPGKARIRFPGRLQVEPAPVFNLLRQ
jgi:hypothetical protein